MTATEAAELLGVSAETIRRYIRLDQLRANRLPSGHLRIRRADVELLLHGGAEAEEQEPVEQERPPQPRAQPAEGVSPPELVSDAAIQRKRRARPTLVAAVIANGDRVLMTRRRYSGESEMWSWPAGHVDPGEQPEDAVLRELSEELLVSDATVVRHLGDVDYHGDVTHFWPKSGGFPQGYRMLHYLVALSSSTVEVIDHEELLEADWLSLDQVRQATASFPPELAEAAIRFASEAISHSARGHRLQRGLPS